MADITLTRTTNGDRDLVTWETLTSANAAGTVYESDGLRMAVATFQAFGTFDGATLVLQGSNDGTNWVTIVDSSTTSPISLTAAGYAEISTAFAYIRPSTSGGGGSQDIDCILVARG